LRCLDQASRFRPHLADGANPESSDSPSRGFVALCEFLIGAGQPESALRRQSHEAAGGDGLRKSRTAGREPSDGKAWHAGEHA
jgi:hypothetical protein